MRYDTPIFFRKIEQGAYDAATGNYGPPTISETRRMASVFDTGVDMMRLIYGQIEAGSVTAHIQNHYDQTFDRIRIGEKIYKAERVRKLRHKQTFVLTEVQE
ncbi:hypothetical protein [uncultured Dubosiella sp.]|uniref:hypothetical protein n=1 Tax=uncultured Dubosiella sp. TaxID=1937011 RepID=UPI0027319A34|nr:hypothetical protein [uncultured Dubosiella sp.]